MSAKSRMTWPHRWVVTGGCGFIGSVLARRLLGRGDVSIRILDDLSKGSLEALPEEVRSVAGDQRPEAPWLSGAEVWITGVEEQDGVDACLTGAEVVVHLAASTGVVQSIENPHRDMQVNVLGTLNVLDAARRLGIPRVVFASSAAAVGTAEPPVSERSLPRPYTPYGAGKLASEAYASAYAQTFDLQTVCLRFGNVYGPYSGTKDSVVARFVKQWMDGETLVVYGDGGQTRDFIYLEDLLEAVIKAATVDGLGGEVFQVATSRETSINELVTALERAIRELGQQPPTVEHGPPRVGDVRRNFADTSFTKRKLGWEARTSLHEGLKTTVAWFLAQRVSDATQSPRNA